MIYALLNLGIYSQLHQALNITSSFLKHFLDLALGTLFSLSFLLAPWLVLLRCHFLSLPPSHLQDL